MLSAACVAITQKWNETGREREEVVMKEIWEFQPCLSVPFHSPSTKPHKMPVVHGTAYNQVYASDVWQGLARLKDILLGKILELPLDVKCKISAISAPLSFFCVTLLLSSHSGSVSKVSQSQ